MSSSFSSDNSSYKRAPLIQKAPGRHWASSSLLTNLMLFGFSLLLCRGALGSSAGSFDLAPLLLAYGLASWLSQWPAPDPTAGKVSAKPAPVLVGQLHKNTEEGLPALQCQPLGISIHCVISPPARHDQSLAETTGAWGYGTTAPECNFHIFPQADLPRVLNRLPDQCLIQLACGKYHYTRMPELKIQQSLQAEAECAYEPPFEWPLYVQVPGTFLYQPLPHTSYSPLYVAAWQDPHWTTAARPILSPAEGYAWPFALVLGQESRVAGIALELHENKLGSALALADSFDSKATIERLVLIDDPGMTVAAHELPTCMGLNNQGGKATPCQQFQGEQQPSQDQIQGSSNEPSEESSASSGSASPPPPPPPLPPAGQPPNSPPPPEEEGDATTEVPSEEYQDPLLLAIQGYLNTALSPYDFWNRLRAILIWIMRNSGRVNAQHFIDLLAQHTGLPIILEHLAEPPPHSLIESLYHQLTFSPTALRTLLSDSLSGVSGEEMKRALLIALIRSTTKTTSDAKKSEPSDNVSGIFAGYQPSNFVNQQSNLLLSDLNTLFTEQSLADHLQQLALHFADTPAILQALTQAVMIETNAGLPSTFDDCLPLETFSNSAAVEHLASLITQSATGLPDFLALLVQSLSLEHQPLLWEYLQLLLHPYQLEPETATILAAEPAFAALLNGPRSNTQLTSGHLLLWFSHEGGYDVPLSMLIQRFSNSNAFLQLLVMVLNQSLPPDLHITLRDLTMQPPPNYPIHPTDEDLWRRSVSQEKVH